MDNKLSHAVVADLRTIVDVLLNVRTQSKSTKNLPSTSNVIWCVRLHRQTRLFGFDKV